MSKQDSHFFNVFSLVIGLLVATALVLIAVSRAVHEDTQSAHIVDDPQYLAGLETRIAPPVRVAVAGQDNSALAIAQASAAESSAPAPGAGGSGLPVPAEGAASGEQTYNTACAACHGQGIAGAPKIGDAGAWGPRIAQGKDTLYKHAIEGFTGQTGVMPPKGGRVDLPDDVIKAAVDYMTQQSQ